MKLRTPLQDRAERAPHVYLACAAMLSMALAACSDENGHGEHGDDPLSHCETGYEPALDQDVGPKDFFNEQGDAPMPPKIVDWLTEQGWQQQHDDWHNIRRWDSSCRGVQWSTVTDREQPQCDTSMRLLERGLWRAPIQEGAPGDGYAFLAMHRHMLEGIRQAFPDHPDLFDGFARVPRTTDDPENPIPGREIRWTEDQLAALDKLENLEDHLDEFPTEDDLGLYIEAPFRWTEENPAAFVADSTSGIHFMLHAQWSIPGSPVLLGNGFGVIENRVFWELHGWIDNVWQNYRELKGLAENDERYVNEIRAQCEEMHRLGEAYAAAGEGI